MYTANIDTKWLNIQTARLIRNCLYPLIISQLTCRQSSSL